LLETPRQLLDRRGAELGPALLAGVQRRKVHLAEVSGSLRPSALRRLCATEAKRLNDQAARLDPALQRLLRERKDRFAAQALRFRPATLQSDLDRKGKALSDTVARLGDAGHRALETWRRKLDALGRLNESLSYKATLSRGFVVVRSEGKVITDSKAAKSASDLELEFADGRARVGARPAKRSSPAKPPEQGSLF